MMKKKYMDFVPSKGVKAPGGRVAIKRSATEKVAKATTPKIVKDEVTEQGLMREDLISKDRLEVETSSFTLKKEPKYGVVEDFYPKFVKTEVPKRPLSGSHFANKKGELAEAKAVKVSAKKIAKPVEKSEKTDKVAENKAEMKIPKSPFVNQVKVEKRPLSKNTYKRSVKPTEEKSTGPVAIIATPEKDAKAGRVIAIILAIILGAAAGTVAFLLLPK